MEKRYVSHVKRYYKRYVLIIFLLLVILAVGGWLFVRHYKPLLSERLKKEIYLASDSLYRVDYSGVHLNPFVGSFTLDSFHLIPDTVTYNRLKVEHRAPPNLLDVFIGSFQMRQMKLWSLISHKKVNIGVVKAENPIIGIDHIFDEKGQSPQTIRKALSNLITGPLHSIEIDHLGLHNITLHYNDHTRSKGGYLSLKNMELVFKDIAINSTTVEDTTRFLFASDAWFHLDESRFFTPDSLYEITTGGIGFSIVKQQGLVKDLKITPQITERAFDRLQTYRNNLFKISADSLLLSGLSIQDIQNKRWHITRAHLQHLSADIYLNSGLRIEPIEKPLPQEALRRAAADLMIDTLRLDDINFKYRELNPNSSRIGYVTFENTYGTISNITNDSTRISKNAHCRADLHTRFMGRGDLHAVFDFNLADPNCAFTYKGHLGYLNATLLNPASLPLGLVKIKSGRIHSLDYNFRADNSGAFGEVGLKFDRLGVSVLSKSAETGDLQKKGLVSLAANLLLLKDNNLYDSLAVQQSTVGYLRDPERSVFNLIWKSIFTGAKVMVGIDEHTENRINALKNTGERLKETIGRQKKDKDGNFLQRAKDFFRKKAGHRKAK